ERFDLIKGHEAYVAELSRHFPRQGAAIREALALMGSAAQSALPLLADRALPPWLSRMVGPFLRARTWHYSDRTTQDVLRPRLRDPRLFDVMTAQWGYYGLPPGESSFLVHAMTCMHFLEGGYYPVGGSGSIL